MSNENQEIISLYNHLKTLHKQWFYDKLEMDNKFIKVSNTDGLLRNNGEVDQTEYLTSIDISGKANINDLSDVAFSGSYEDLEDVPQSFPPSTHTHNATDITDNIAYTNIDVSANSSQEQINIAIDNKISALLGVDLVSVVNDKGTASANTMNKLYFVPETTSASNDNYEIFVTVRTGTSGAYNYAWEKIDCARINVTGLSLDTHIHGNITREGKVGSLNNQFITTTTGGAVTNKSTIGNIDLDGAIGSTAGKVAVTSTGGVIVASDWFLELDDLVVDLINEGLRQENSNGE